LKAPEIISSTAIKLKDEARRKKLTTLIFAFPGALADLRYFKNQIYKFILGDRSKTFTQTCWDMVYERNDQGRTCKYLHFNERSQRLYLDKAFFEWAKLTIDKMEEELQQCH
jgi:hypothetical protein